ncbi:MAG: hypothetical protein Q9226_000732 [Calogaya cf. arnoldii]
MAPALDDPSIVFAVVAAGSSRKPRAKATSKDVTIQVDDEESFGEEDYEASDSGESGQVRYSDIDRQQVTLEAHTSLLRKASILRHFTQRSDKQKDYDTADKVSLFSTSHYLTTAHLVRPPNSPPLRRLPAYQSFSLIFLCIDSVLEVTFGKVLSAVPINDEEGNDNVLEVSLLTQLLAEVKAQRAELAKDMEKHRKIQTAQQESDYYASVADEKVLWPWLAERCFNAEQNRFREDRLRRPKDLATGSTRSKMAISRIECNASSKEILLR